jgi:phospholipid/cholesterol/gamma-HCH transport system ATP-binding protein
VFRLTHVTKTLSGRPVLDRLDLDMPQKGVTFVVGASGAGKSVLARCCVGLMHVDAGEVRFGDERIDEWPERRLSRLRRRCPYVAQGSGLFDWLTLQANVELPLRKALGVPQTEAASRAHEALERVGVTHVANAYPHEVGPGVHKRTAIARAVALQPEAILYDEPTTGIDPVTARRIDELIRSLADAGTPTLVVSHDLESIRLTADRVALLDGGKVAFQGTPAEFFSASTVAVAAFLGT